MNVVITREQHDLIADERPHDIDIEADGAGRWRLVVDGLVGLWTPPVAPADFAVPHIDISYPPPMRLSFEPALDRLTAAAERIAPALERLAGDPPAPTATLARLRAAAAAVCADATCLADVLMTDVDASVAVRRSLIDALRAAAREGT